MESASIKFQHRVPEFPAGGAHQQTSCREQEGVEGSWLLLLSCSSHNPEGQRMMLHCNRCSGEPNDKYCVRADVHLCVDLLWDGVLLDPGMNFSQLLSLVLGEPRLEGLKHPEFLPVICQHLILVPAQTRCTNIRKQQNLQGPKPRIYLMIGIYIALKI